MVRGVGRRLSYRKFVPGHCLKFKIVIGGREQVVHNNVRAAGSREKS